MGGGLLVVSEDVVVLRLARGICAGPDALADGSLTECGADSSTSVARLCLGGGWCVSLCGEVPVW